MIQSPTVLILGAGASAEYGLPIGAALITQIVDALGETGVLRQALVNAQLSQADLEDFACHLAGADLTSIDAFLEKNTQKFVQIGKACIATMILFREQDARTRLFVNPPSDHWLKYVWNLMRAEADVSSFAGNQVSFVTFNYDRLLEYYYDTVLASAFNLSGPNARDLRERAIRIVHLHGAVVGRAFGEYTHPLDGTTVRDIAAGIRIIHDTMPTDDPGFEAAYELVQSASKVCLLGFGYHPENLRRLRLKSLLENRGALYGSAVGLGKAELEVARERIGIGFQAGGPSEKAEVFLRENVPLA
jgi:hypothetical protein